MSTSTTISHPTIGARQWGALGVLTLAVFLLAIDSTVLNLAVPRLSESLKPTAVELLWIGDSYSLAVAGFLVTMGNLADRVGRKKLLLAGSVAFGISSVIAAFSVSPAMLIAARVLLGVSGATIMPSTLSIIRDVFRDPGQRMRAIAIWSAGTTAGMAFGPLAGGVLLEHFWWGSVFLINVPVMVVVLVAGTLILPESYGRRGNRVDLASVVLSILALVSLVWAFKHLMSHGADPAAVVVTVIGLVTGVIFVRRQGRLRTPLIDVSLFRIPSFSGAVVVNALATFALAGLLFFFSQYLQLVRGMSPMRAGLMELPATLASVLVVAITVPAASRLGLGRAITAGMVVAAGGLAGLSVAEGAGWIGWLILALAVIGLGTGLAYTLSTDAVVSAAPVERAGAASAISETAYELGASLGIAILGSVQTLTYRAHLDLDESVPGDLVDTARESLAAIVASADPSSPRGALVLEHAREAFVEGMQMTSLVAAALVLAAAVLAWALIPSRVHR